MPSKSFRVAADRIVRQESASPTDALRLLGSPPVGRRTIASEIDEWSARLAALSVIAEYDALAFMASKPVRMSHAQNVSEQAALEEAIVAAHQEVARTSMAVRLRASIALTDGRLSTEVTVAAPGDRERGTGVLGA